MLAISVEFLHGTFRAGSPDDIAMTGNEDPGEWPPSPARLFSALVSSDGTGTRTRVTDGSELEELESLSPPTIVAEPRGSVSVGSLRPRFVVADERHTDNKSGMTSAVQEYVGRTNTLVRPSPRLSPRVPRVIYVWPDAQLDEGTVAALRARCARVAYLGCSDSPARVRVLESSESSLAAEGGWRPDESGRVALPVPFPGFTRALDAAFERWQTGPARRSWTVSRRVRYRGPDDAAAPSPKPTVFWLRLGSSLPGRWVLPVTETFRSAVLDRCQRVAGAAALPPVLLGHGFDATGFQHVHWLALPDVGFQHSSGRIHGLAVWLPVDASPDALALVAEAVRGLKELVLPGRFLASVEGYGGESRPLAATPHRWSRRSRRWVSTFPVVHERWTGKRGPGHEEIESWFVHAGIRCRVVDFKNSPVPILRGSPRLRPDEVHRKGRARLPFSYLEVVLDRQIEGPVMIGRGRQFGLGLMLPGD